MSRVTARVVLVIVLTWLLAIFGCGHDQHLDSISISPNNVTINGAGLDLHYTALGHYSHPPNTKDITDQLLWESSAPQIITVDQNGVATSGLGCGTNLQITATSSPRTPKSDSVIVGRVTVNVTQPPVVS
jgi:hypothetical protein